MENFVSNNLPLHSLVQLFFYLLLITYAIFSSVLYYHWQNYALDETATKHTYLAYFLISIPLLAIMAFSVFLI